MSRTLSLLSLLLSAVLSRLHALLPLLLPVVLAASLGSCSAGGPPAPGPAPTTPDAPTGSVSDFDPEIVFSTVNMAGENVDESAFAESELTMINLWAYWCGPCVGEMPDIERLYQNYRDRGLMIWGISDEEYEKDNLSVIGDLNITYPCLRYVSAFDPWMATGYIPTTIFVDRTGKVVGETYVGGRSYEDWAAIVEDLLP